MPVAPYTLPAPGDTWLVAARSAYLRRTARMALAAPEPLPPHLRQALDQVREPLAAAAAMDRAGFLSALSLPCVGAPLHAGAPDRALPNLLLELARRRLLPREGAFWGAPVHAMSNPRLGISRRYSPPVVGALFSGGALAVAKAEEWTLAPEVGSFHAMREGGWLALHDDNPLAAVEAHPDKEGNAIDLGEASAETWLARVDEARALVRGAWPELADEHAQVLALVCPVGTHAERSNSASYRESIGQVYVSLHPSPLKMAEALVHETQHNKLNLLAYLDPVLHDAGTLHDSPVRPDPRPLWGVLLAVHAFVPVAELYRRLHAAGHPEATPARVLDAERVVHEGLVRLREHARPTELGARVLAGIEAVVATW